jgi:hypothetical protein
MLIMKKKKWKTWPKKKISGRNRRVWKGRSLKGSFSHNTKIVWRSLLEFFKFNLWCYNILKIKNIVLYINDKHLCIISIKILFQKMWNNLSNVKHLCTIDFVNIFFCKIFEKQSIKCINNWEFTCILFLIIFNKIKCLIEKFIICSNMDFI